MADGGKGGRSPWAIPPGGWWAALKRAWAEASDDNIGLIAAGVAFYAFLSTVPLLGAVVLVYGIVADTATVQGNVTALTEIMPREVARLIGEQLLTVVTTSDGKKGFGLLAALALALYGATKGAGAIVTALNVAYEEKERRGFVHVTLLQLGLVVGAVIVVLSAFATTTLAATIGRLLAGAPGIVLGLIRLASYLLLAALVATAAAALFRFGPDRRSPRWVWLTPGSVASTLLWIALTGGFGVYVANFGSYDATYGSLGAIVVMLTWLWLSAYLFLLGAELNAELERQVAPAPRLVTPAAPAPAKGVPPALVAAIGLTVVPWRRTAGAALILLAAAAIARRRRA